MNTFDCNAGFSLITARPAAPTWPKPIPAPPAAIPNARPAPKSFIPADSDAVPSWAYAKSTIPKPDTTAAAQK